MKNYKNKYYNFTVICTMYTIVLLLEQIPHGNTALDIISKAKQKALYCACIHIKGFYW